jgi:hypothetical protein
MAALIVLYGKGHLVRAATSASSERGFSVGKDVFGISRMSLNPETVEALVCEMTMNLFVISRMRLYNI